MSIERFDEVLEAAQRGEGPALETIYRDLAPLVLGYLRGRGARDPEDLTSETFVAVVRNLPRFRGDQSRLRTWVLTIAHRRLIDARRKATRRPEWLVEPASVTEALGGAEADAAADALARLGDRDMVRLLDQLTDDQRAVVLLRIVADLSVNDVARILKKRPGAIKTTHRRALANLGRLLAGRDPRTPAPEAPTAEGSPNTTEGDEPSPASSPLVDDGFPPEVLER